VSNSQSSSKAAQMWTTEDVANYLGVPIATLYSWRKRKQGPKAYRIGKHLRFHSRDVNEWLEQQTA